MAIDKLIPQYLNKDEDARLIKSTEMSNAVNVRVSNDADGNQGVLKNVKGNTAIEALRDYDAIPTSGSSRVIGSVASEAGKCIYYFLYNTSSEHGIYHYLMLKLTLLLISLVSTCCILLMITMSLERLMLRRL